MYETKLLSSQTWNPMLQAIVSLQATEVPYFYSFLSDMSQQILVAYLN